MNQQILGKCVTQLDNVSTSHITGFTCKPEIGECVSVYMNGKPIDLEVCGIRHTYENTHSGYVPVLEVELTTKKQIL